MDQEKNSWKDDSEFYIFLTQIFDLSVWIETKIVKLVTIVEFEMKWNETHLNWKIKSKIIDY